MNNYDTLLIELLNRLDKKADRLISLLEAGTAALAAEVQEPQKYIRVCASPRTETEEERKALTDTIRDILLEQMTKPGDVLDIETGCRVKKVFAGKPIPLAVQVSFQMPYHGWLQLKKSDAWYRLLEALEDAQKEQAH